MTTVRAAVCHHHGAPLSVEEVSLRAPLPGEIEVALDACAICHSDIAFMDGDWGGTLPAIYGHEAAGRVSAVGEGVRGYAPGDTVLVTLMRSCGCCVTCASGAPAVCTTPVPMEAPITLADGRPVEQAMACGAFAERVLVQPSQIARLPEDMPMDVASLLSCGVITGVGSVVNVARLRPGQAAVVIGTGGIGLNAIQGAHIAGADRIVAVDTVPEKLKVAREFGATDTILADKPEPWKELEELTGGRLADAVFVTVGVASVYDSAVKYLGPRGKVVMVGMPPVDARASYDPSSVAAMGQQFLGTKMGDTVLARDIPWLIDLYQQGRLKLDELISGRWPFDRINDAIVDAKAGASLRNVVLFE